MKTGFTTGEISGRYSTTRPVTPEEIIAMAAQLVKRKFSRGRVIDSPKAAANYLLPQLACLEQETFWGLFLDNQHRILAFEQLFTGTLTHAAVYPREVVKRSLQLNAAAVIFVHNHPSGRPDPSDSDRAITQQLKQALALIDISVLDHLIVAAEAVTSMAERGEC